jgi:hypothetical protein
MPYKRKMSYKFSKVFKKIKLNVFDNSAPSLECVGQNAIQTIALYLPPDALVIHFSSTSKTIKHYLYVNAGSFWKAYFVLHFDVDLEQLLLYHFNEYDKLITHSNIKNIISALCECNGLEIFYSLAFHIQFNGKKSLITELPLITPNFKFNCINVELNYSYHDTDEYNIGDDMEIIQGSYDLNLIDISLINDFKSFSMFYQTSNYNKLFDIFINIGEKTPYSFKSQETEYMKKIFNHIIKQHLNSFSSFFQNELIAKIYHSNCFDYFSFKKTLLNINLLHPIEHMKKITFNGLIYYKATFSTKETPIFEEFIVGTAPTSFYSLFGLHFKDEKKLEISPSSRFYLLCKNNPVL